MLTLVWDNGQMALDATVSEQHMHRVRITAHPIERGGNPVDHVVLLPAGLKVEGIFTDYPLPNANGQTTVGTGITGSGRADYLVDKLRDLQAAATVFEVNTGIKTYADMLLEDIGEPRDKGIDAAARVSLTFVYARFVSSQTAALTKPATPAGSGKASGGKQTGTPATSGQAKRVSILKSVLQKAAALSK